MILALIIMLSVFGYTAGIALSAYLGGRICYENDARALALGYVFWPMLLIVLPFLGVFILVDGAVSLGSKHREERG